MQLLAQIFFTAKYIERLVQIVVLERMAHLLPNNGLRYSAHRL